MNKRLLKLGITGGYATGKTTLCKVLKSLGVEVFLADEVVNTLYSKKEVKEKLKETFGKGIERQGEINKAFIRQKILKNPELKKKLEAIFHPLVKKELESFFKEQEKRGALICAAEVPLLFEAGWEKLFDEVWVIFCNKELQLKRGLERGLSPDEVKSFIKHQLPLEEKLNKADRTITTEISIQELRSKVQSALKELRLKAQSFRAE